MARLLGRRPWLLAGALVATILGGACILDRDGGLPDAETTTTPGGGGGGSGAGTTVGGFATTTDTTGSTTTGSGGQGGEPLLVDCGDGEVELPEQCEDGNATAGDG